MNDRMTDRAALDRAHIHDIAPAEDLADPKGLREASFDALAQTLAQLGESELFGRLERLVQRRGQLTAELLVHLGEVDRRKLYLAQACSSMHGYCTARLHLSDAAAYRHIRAARLGRQFPLLLELVAAGKLHLTAICLLSPHLTPENHRQLLEAAVHRTKREVELLVAERFPRPDVPSQLRKLPGPRQRSSGAAVGTTVQPSVSAAEVAASQAALVAVQQSAEETCRTEASLKERPESTEEMCRTAASSKEPPGEKEPRAKTLGAAPSATPTSAHGAPLAPERAKSAARRRAVVEPLAPGRFKVQLTAGQSLHDKLRQAQDLMRNELPSGDLEVICERALDLLLETLLRRKFAVTDKPRSSERSRKGQEATSERSAERGRHEAKGELAAETGHHAATGERSAEPGRHEAMGERTAEMGYRASDGLGSQPGAAPSRRRHRSRHIPNAVKRAVAERDGMRCTFVDARGRRCEETGGLELHHIEGFARGGAAKVENIALRCRAHNRYDAEQHYGAAHVELRIRQQRERRKVRPTAIGI